MLAPRAVKRKTAAKAALAPAAVAGSTTADKAVAGTEAADTGTAFITTALGVQDVKTAQAAVVISDIAEQPSEDLALASKAQDTEPVASTSQLQPDPAEQKKKKQEQERLLLLRFIIEECLSDWGLSCQHPELLRKLENSTTGFIHLSNLLSLPEVSCRTSSLTDITASIFGGTSDSIELDETGFQIKRKTAPNYEQLSKISVEEWAEQTFYLENIPKPPKGRSYTLDSLREYLSRLLESNIDALRLPPLYTLPRRDKLAEKTDASMQDAETVGGLHPPHVQDPTDTVKLQFDAPKSDSGKTLHQYAIPQNGGPFKGFAFIVVRGKQSALRAKERWSWDSKGKRTLLIEEESEHQEADESSAVDEDLVSENAAKDGTDDSHPEAPLNASTSQGKDVEATETAADSAPEPGRTPEQLANRSGLCIMPIEEFNTLRLEYLRYMRDITVLKEKQEALQVDSFSKRQQRRSVSPERLRNKRRSPSPAKWERKARSPSPDIWERKPLSPLRDERPTRRYDDVQDDDYPRGCVCFVKRFHPDSRSGVLKTLFQSILELEEVSPRDHLQHVDHKRNVDSCHVRFTDAATASFFASYFSGNPKYSHVDPHSTDPTEAFAAVRKGENIRPVEVEVISGIPEAIYWSTVPKGIRKAYGGTKQEISDAGEAAERDSAAQDAPIAENGASLVLEDSSASSKKRPLDVADIVENGAGSESSKQARLDISS